MRSLEHDERVRAALRSGGRFRRLQHHASVSSTNDVALAAVREGEPPGVVIVADRQTAGRGRSGGVWTDDVRGPDGPANLAVTATTRRPDGPLGLVPLAAGVAVVEAFSDLGVCGELKWPNDVLVDGRKAGGILVEHHLVRGRDLLLIGCGLDLDWRGVVREPDTTGWISVAEVTGRGVDRGAVLAALLAALNRRLDDVNRDADWLRHDYTLRCATIGNHVRASLPGGDVIVGDAVGIDGDGRLELRLASGRTTAVSAGAVSHLRRT